MRYIYKLFKIKTIRGRIIAVQLGVIIPAIILLGVMIYSMTGSLLIRANSESYAKILRSSDVILSHYLEYYRDIARGALADFGEPGRIATPVAPLPVEYDYYLDPNFRYTEYGRVMLETIKEAAKAAGKTYVVGDNQGDIDEDLNRLRKSGQAILLFDTAEPNIDSSVLQGIAYGLGRKPIVYASNQQRVLMSGRFVIQLNTMNYYSAEAVVHSMEELLGMISE